MITTILIILSPLAVVAAAVLQVKPYRLLFQHTHSRDFAHWRLRHIIAADRSAVPCGRWVLMPSWPSRYQAWAMQNAFRVFTARKPPPSPFDSRPHYRYEVRR